MNFDEWYDFQENPPKKEFLSLFSELSNFAHPGISDGGIRMLDFRPAYSLSTELAGDYEAFICSNFCDAFAEFREKMVRMGDIIPVSIEYTGESIVFKYLME